MFSIRSLYAFKNPSLVKLFSIWPKENFFLIFKSKHCLHILRKISISYNKKINIMCVNPYFTQLYFFSSNPYGEEHVHTFCLSKQSYSYSSCAVGIFYIFRNFLPDVKRAFNHFPNPPFLFFLFHPSLVFDYHHVIRSTSTNTS